MSDIHEAHAGMRRIHLSLDPTLPTDSLAAETGAPVSCLVRAGLAALADLHRKSPRRARSLVARHDITPGRKPR